MELPQDKKVYNCTYEGCKSSFDRPYRLAQHLLAHNNIRPYACSETNCSKAYTSKSHLDRHINSVHKPNEKNPVVYSCPQCFNYFANRQNLKRHMISVHMKEFSCDVCKIGFRKKNQLSAHMFLHTGLKAFNCDFCSESFITLYQKKRHVRVHKTYNCMECSAVFNQWSKYQKHKKTDHKNKEYICDLCGRHFKERLHIVKHIKAHAREHIVRTFPCPYQNCTRFYSRNSNLKQHILVKHMNVFHECHMCNAQLSTKAKLNYHIQLHYKAGIVPTKDDNRDRKTRKDEGSFKTSTALKLAGLNKPPEDDERTNSPINLSVVNTEYIECEVDLPLGY